MVESKEARIWNPGFFALLPFLNPPQRFDA
jgi:hypothetical protein